MVCYEVIFQDCEVYDFSALARQHKPAALDADTAKAASVPNDAGRQAETNKEDNRCAEKETYLHLYVRMIYGTIMRLVLVKC